MSTIRTTSPTPSTPMWCGSAGLSAGVARKKRILWCTTNSTTPTQPWLNSTIWQTWSSRSGGKGSSRSNLFRGRFRIFFRRNHRKESSINYGSNRTFGIFGYSIGTSKRKSTPRCCSKSFLPCSAPNCIRSRTLQVDLNSISAHSGLIDFNLKFL